MAITEVISVSLGNLICFPASPPKLAFFSLNFIFLKGNPSSRWHQSHL